MCQLPYAPDRANNRRRECEEPHVPIYRARRSSAAEDAELLQFMPHGQRRGLGYQCAEAMAERVTVACRKLVRRASLLLNSWTKILNRNALSAEDAATREGAYTVRKLLKP